MTTHAQQGAEIIERNNYKYWKEIHYHGKPNCKYDSLALRLLNTADLTADRNGNYVTVEDRLKDVKQRYGETSFQYIEFVQLAKELELIEE